MLMNNKSVAKVEDRASQSTRSQPRAPLQSFMHASVYKPPMLSPNVFKMEVREYLDISNVLTSRPPNPM